MRNSYCDIFLKALYHLQVPQLLMESGYIGKLNALRPRQNGRHFADDIFKWIFLNENVSIPIKILLKFVPQGPINNTPALVQMMAWRRPGDKPLSEPMMVRLPTQMCVTRPQWVNAECTHAWIPKMFVSGFKIPLVGRTTSSEMTDKDFIIVWLSIENRRNYFPI